MRRDEIKPGVEYAAQPPYRAGDPHRVVLVKHGVGGSYHAVTLVEVVGGGWREVEPRVEWRERGGQGVNTFRFVEPPEREMRVDAQRRITYRAEFVEVRSKDVLGPYDEVMAERAAAKVRRDEAETRKRETMAAYAEQGEALRAALAEMGLAEVFAIDVNNYRPDPPRLRALVPAAEVIEAMARQRETVPS